MKIVMISNFFNHHQQPLSDALSHSADEYLFISTSPIPQERLEFGYREPEESYVLKVLSDDDRAYAMRKVDEADVAIIGSAPESYIRGRLSQKKLTFRYSERPLKNPHESWKFPIRLIRWRRNNPVSAPLYLLCASAYTAGDFARFGLFGGKAYRWGYFPETRRYADIDALMNTKERCSLLWVGRFLHWKHPETAIYAADILRKRGYDFTLTMIGDGEMLPVIRDLVAEYGLADRIRLIGALPYDRVRAYMERSEIFLFTSDQREGWGAVLNEAMNSACAVIVSDRIGSVPYLIQDGVNGMTVECCDAGALADKIGYLMTHTPERRSLSAGAYRTVIDCWNADTAAERLIALCDHLLSGRDTNGLYDDGPCSKAPLLTDG